MATIQVLQSTQFRQPEPPQRLHTCNAGIQQNICRGHSFRDNGDHAPWLGSQPRRNIKSKVGQYTCTYRGHHPLLASRWLFKLNAYGGKLQTGYEKQRCRKLQSPLCCLRTSQVEHMKVREAELEKHSTPSSSGEKNVDVEETKEWAVRKGLSALDAYFDKLHAQDGSTNPSVVTTSRTVDGVSTTLPVSDTSNSGSHRGSQSSQISNVGGVKDNRESRETDDAGGLGSLDSYFNKLRPTETKNVAHVSKEAETAVDENKVVAGDEEKKVKVEIISDTPIEADEEAEYRELLEELEKALEQGAESGGSSTDDPSFLPVPSWGLQAGKSNSYVVNALVAINIAVYLFGLASPKGMPGMADASLPYLYGAKVNELIMNGEWWRLVTPMFLHAGVLHLGLSTWALLSFGPAVESAYGTLGFCMIYFMGGLFGNLMSFFHTPQGTVGGTGPIYALMATWLVYLLRNREIIGLDVADDMIRKVVIMSAINVALCNSFPIDDWNHLGAGTIGLIFGLLTCPMVAVNVHVEETVSENANDDTIESFLLLNEGLHPYRLLLVFALSLAVFFALYSLGVPVATEFHFLHGGLGDEYW